MMKYTFPVTIPANNAAPVNFAAAAIAAGQVLPGGIGSGFMTSSYIPCCKIRAQMAKGGTGVGYLGGSNLLSTGVGASDDLTAATVSVPGGASETVSQQDKNTLNLFDYNGHGGTPGDIMLVTYWQN